MPRLRIIARAETSSGHKYLVTEDQRSTAPYGAGLVVQIAIPGYAVSPPVSLGSMAAHDPYTDWQPIEDPPPLAEILSDV